MAERVQNIVITGAGTASWIAAAVLVKEFCHKPLTITLVDCAEQDTRHQAESSVAALYFFHRKIGVLERDVMAACDGTFKLANAYKSWNNKEQGLFHSHSPYGSMIQSIEFQHFLSKLRQKGKISEINEYSLGAAAAKLGRFAHPKSNAKAFLVPYSYALHLDAQRYHNFLRSNVQAHVSVIKKDIHDIVLRQEDNFIEAIILDDNQRLEADLFIDCTGFSGRLIDKALNVGYDDWSHYLPCDRRVSFSCESFDSETVNSEAVANFEPATSMSVHENGWWRTIPLRRRQCHEFYYCSDYLTDDKALNEVHKMTKGNSINDVLVDSFCPGRRRQFWFKNCIAIGESAGFLGNLTVSNMHFVQSAILRLVALFPDLNCSRFLREEYNQLTGEAYARILDFHALHYDCAGVVPSVFWEGDCEYSLPQSLTHKITLFSRFGRFPFYERETFAAKTWVSFLLGNNYWPENCDPLVQTSNLASAYEHVKKIKSVVSQVSECMPSHVEYLSQYCPVKLSDSCPIDSDAKLDNNRVKDNRQQ